jgi:4-amino-4-deoxy-L-arabinose transferase-like glycosyltransferase
LQLNLQYFAAIAFIVGALIRRARLFALQRYTQCEFSDQTKLTSHLVLIIALCGILYFPYLGNTPFFDKGEPREALAVQDIVQRGEWLFPLKRATAIPSKPPLFHWSAALTAQVTGKLDEATIRFPSALYATLGVLCLYILGRKLYGGEVALLAGAILATTLIYENQALSARVDMTLSFFVTASLLLFYALYRGLLVHPALVLSFVRAGWHRHLGERTAGSAAARTRDRGISRRQKTLGSLR